MVSADEDSETMNEQKTTKIPLWDLPDVPKGNLPAHIELQRTRALCTFDAPTHVFMFTFTQLIFFNSFVAAYFFFFGNVYLAVSGIKDGEYSILGRLCLHGGG